MGGRFLELATALIREKSVTGRSVRASEKGSHTPLALGRLFIWQIDDLHARGQQRRRPNERPHSSHPERQSRTTLLPANRAHRPALMSTPAGPADQFSSTLRFGPFAFRPGRGRKTVLVRFELHGRPKADMEAAPSIGRLGE